MGARVLSAVQIALPVAFAHQIGHTVIRDTVVEKRGEIHANMRGVALGLVLDHDIGFFIHVHEIQHIAQSSLLGRGLGYFFGRHGDVFPSHHTENQVRDGYLFLVDRLSGLFGQAISAIAPCFGYGALIDFGHAGQYDVVLMVFGGIQKTAKCFLAEMNFSQYVTVVKVVYLGSWG
jgi:hypothetical protein